MKLAVLKEVAAGDARVAVTRRSYRYIRAEELLNDGSENEAISELDAFFNEVLGSTPPTD